MNDDRIKIDFSEYGASIGSRELAAKIREQVSKHIDNGRSVLFDFKGISIISSAFADELFGKIYQKLGKTGFTGKIKINGFMDNQTRDLILQIIQKSFSLRDRMQAQAGTSA